MSMSGKQMMALEALLLEELIAERDSLRKRVKDLEKQPKQKPVAVFDEKFGRPKMLANAPILTHGQKFYTTPPQPKTPPECIADAEKIAFAYGWWKALEAQRLALSKQEPVAWGVDWGEAGGIPCVSIIKRLPDGGIEVLAVEYAPCNYTTQPNQTWVGLTDEERLEAAEIDGADEWFWKVCKAIEAKLKEKNT